MGNWRRAFPLLFFLAACSLLEQIPSILERKTFVFLDKRATACILDGQGFCRVNLVVPNGSVCKSR